MCEAGKRAIRSFSSLRSQDSEIDLYTPISTMIEAEVGVEVIVIPTN